MANDDPDQPQVLSLFDRLPQPPVQNDSTAADKLAGLLAIRHFNRQRSMRPATRLPRTYRCRPTEPYRRHTGWHRKALSKPSQHRSTLPVSHGRPWPFPGDARARTFLERGDTG